MPGLLELQHLGSELIWLSSPADGLEACKLRRQAARLVGFPSTCREARQTRSALHLEVEHIFTDVEESGSSEMGTAGLATTCTVRFDQDGQENSEAGPRCGVVENFLKAPVAM